MKTTFNHAWIKAHSGCFTDSDIQELFRQLKGEHTKNRIYTIKEFLDLEFTETFWSGDFAFFLAHLTTKKESKALAYLLAMVVRPLILSAANKETRILYDDVYMSMEKMYAGNNIPGKVRLFLRKELYEKYMCSYSSNSKAEIMYVVFLTVSGYFKFTGLITALYNYVDLLDDSKRKYYLARIKNTILSYAKQ